MLNPRLEALRDYPFQRLRALLDGHQPGALGGDAGLKVINLSIGEPQHPFPAFVGEIIQRTIADFGRYPPVPGSVDLRHAIRDWLTRRYELPEGMIDAERHIVPVTGTREGLYSIAQAVVPQLKAGAQPIALMPNPFYQAYLGAAVLSGAEPVPLAALPEKNFLPDLDAISHETLARTAIFYLCSPANPQGTTADFAYLKRIVEMARQYDFLFVSDECYAEIYTREKPLGVLDICRTMKGDMSNVVAFHSLSKRSSAPGLRSGFAVGDPQIMAAYIKLRSYSSPGIPGPLEAAAAALWRDEAHVEKNRDLYREKYDDADRILGNRFGYYRPAGSFYLWLDVGDSEAAALKLWREAAVRTLPGKYLVRDAADASRAGDNYLRIALVADPATTREALERIRDTLGQ